MRRCQSRSDWHCGVGVQVELTRLSGLCGYRYSRHRHLRSALVVTGNFKFL